MSGIEELALLAQRNNNQADGGSIVLGFIGLALIVGAIVLLAIRYPNYRASSDSDVWVVLAAVLLALFTLGYMLPSSIAIVRKVRNVGSIIVINFFLGWTLIGWIVALAMAASSKPQPLQQQTNVYVQQHPTGPPQPIQPISQPTQPPTSQQASDPSEPKAIPPPPPERPDDQ